MAKSMLKLLKNNLVNGTDKERKFENIRKFFDMSMKGDYTLDDQTWQDLDMDRVYEKVDRTYSGPGQSALYFMLRNPLSSEEELRQRDKYIEVFKGDDKLTESLLDIFFKLNKDPKNYLLNMMDKGLVINKAKYYLYTFMGRVFPLIMIVISIIMGDIRYLAAALGVGVVNMFINFNEINTIKSKGILYLRKLIKSAKRIASIDNKDISHYTERIKYILKEIKDIDRGTRLIGFVNMWEGVFEAISVLFLLEESTYYAISDKIRDKKDLIMELYQIVGEIEALMSVSGYQMGLKQKYVKPKFISEIALRISDGVHPLIEDPVPNSIDIRKKGIVLTGTNMSGKSTFLRMLGVNILFAQTFNFVLATDYEAPFFNIVSSISPRDDITRGKSYYMAEVEAILRIIRALDKELPVFCIIDEIFRGTNPVERIAMSGEILEYISSGRSISLVATHDRELVDILHESYEFYYFSESVDSRNGLSFDYKLKRGTSQTRNAIKLLEFVGYPREIITKAHERARKIDGIM